MSSREAKETLEFQKEMKKYKLFRSPANHSMPTRRCLHRRSRVHAYDALKKRKITRHSTIYYKWEFDWQPHGWRREGERKKKKIDEKQRDVTAFIQMLTERDSCFICIVLMLLHV